MVILNSKYCDLEALIESLVESGEMDDYNCGELIMVDVAEDGDVIAVDEPASESPTKTSLLLMGYTAKTTLVGWNVAGHYR